MLNNSTSATLGARVCVTSLVVLCMFEDDGQGSDNNRMLKGGIGFF